MTDEVEKIKHNLGMVSDIMDAAKDGRDYIDIKSDSGAVVGQMTITPDLLREMKRYLDSVERSKKEVETRQQAVAKEVAAIGCEVLPIGQSVTVHGGLEGVVIEISHGYKDRPYYKVFLKNAEGIYGDPEDERNYGYFYARNFRNYGRGA